ncbi:MAG TPA: hypothetical protein VFV70_15470 [Hyphomonadaceae bacterium]|nr:hypothetical protein [Hyphomonadaceae bacterium]
MKPVRILAPAACSLAVAAAAWAEDAAGKWSGVVAGAIPIVITVTKAADGKLSATLESTAQAPGQQFPLDTITSDGATLSFSLAMVQASFTGRWDAAQKAWVGTFTQGADVPLSLTRAQ